MLRIADSLTVFYYELDNSHKKENDVIFLVLYRLLSYNLGSILLKCYMFHT